LFVLLPLGEMKDEYIGYKSLTAALETKYKSKRKKRNTVRAVQSREQTQEADL